MYSHDDKCLDVAARALQGLLACPLRPQPKAADEGKTYTQFLAEEALVSADALLCALDQEDPEDPRIAAAHRLVQAARSRVAAECAFNEAQGEAEIIATNEARTAAQALQEQLLGELCGLFTNKDGD